MPDIASVKREFYVQWLAEKRDVIDGRERVTTYYESAPATLSDLIALIEGGSEEEKARFLKIIEPYVDALITQRILLFMQKLLMDGSLFVEDDEEQKQYGIAGRIIPAGICGDSVVAREDVVAEQERVTREMRERFDAKCARCHAPLAGRPEDHECER